MLCLFSIPAFSSILCPILTCEDGRWPTTLKLNNKRFICLSVYHKDIVEIPETVRGKLHRVATVHSWCY